MKEKKRKKVNEISRETGLTIDEVIKGLQELGVKVKSPTTSVDEEIYLKFKKKLGFETIEGKKEKKAFIRRTKPSTVEEQKPEPAPKTPPVEEVVSQPPPPSEAPEVKKVEEKVEEAEVPPPENIPQPPPPEEILESTTPLPKKKPKLKKPLSLRLEEEYGGPKKKPIPKKEVFKLEDLYTEEERARFQVRKKSSPKRPVQKPIITVPKDEKRVIRFEKSITVAEIAVRMGVKVKEIIEKLKELGISAEKFSELDYETASLIASEYKYTVEREIFDPKIFLEEFSPEDRVEPRPPVVTVMGHVDHGKTTLLDAIRQTNIAASEAGGITQKIGASVVKIPSGTIVFIDTPGHEAFTSMRARGALVTDIVVLVVAGDDGVMPQTEEAINHAKAAGVPIIVAINKIDKNEANPEMVKKQLSERGLIPEEWGGDTIFVNVSALHKKGIKELLESILLLAEMLELKANPSKRGFGIVIESRLEKGRGPVASVIVKNGTLRVGNWVVCGPIWGRIRAMVGHDGKNLSEAKPSYPVEIFGLNGVPSAGDKIYAVESEEIAKKIAEHIAEENKKIKGEIIKPDEVTLEDLFQKISDEKEKSLNIILKAKEQGALEAIEWSIKKIKVESVKINIIHHGIGDITENDVMLASASGGIIIGFNVKVDPMAKEALKRERVQVKIYDIIYKLLDELELVCSGSVETKPQEKEIGRVEVRRIFDIQGIGRVLGCYVLDGKVVRNYAVKVERNGEILGEGRVTSLKRFKEDVKEVQKGLECGMVIEGVSDIAVGDKIRIYEINK